MLKFTQPINYTTLRVRIDHVSSKFSHSQFYQIIEISAKQILIINILINYIIINCFKKIKNYLVIMFLIKGRKKDLT